MDIRVSQDVFEPIRVFPTGRGDIDYAIDFFKLERGYLRETRFPSNRGQQQKSDKCAVANHYSGNVGIPTIAMNEGQPNHSHNGFPAPMA
jgi:hypothetical protein